MWVSRMRKAIRARMAASGGPSPQAQGRMRCQGCAAFSQFAASAPPLACPLGLPSGPRPLPSAQSGPGHDTAPLVIDVLSRGGYRLARLEGEVDLATACELRFMLHSQLAGDPRLAVDVAGLAFIDVLGIRILSKAAEQAARAGGWVRIIGAGPRLRRLLDLLGDAHPLPVYEDEDGAARNLGAGRVEPRLLRAVPAGTARDGTVDRPAG